MSLHRILKYCFSVITVLLFSLPVQAATGTFPTAVFLVNFQDDTARPITRQDADKVVFSDPNSVKKYFEETSYGKALYTGKVFDWVTLPINKTCNMSVIFNEIVKKFSSTVNFQDYRQVVMFALSAGCSASGYGGSETITTPSGTFTIGSAWIGINANTTLASLLASNTTRMEVGHYHFGGHSNSYDCGSVAFGPATSCTMLEYGNPYDVMGSGQGQFDGSNKEVVGWFEPSNVLTVTQDGDYTLEALEIASPNPKALKILIGATHIFKWFYADYRQPIGFDSNLYANRPIVGNVYRGASIYYVESGISYLLDATPASQSLEYIDRLDGALEPGNIIYDSVSGVTLTTRTAYMPDGITPDPNRITVRVAGVPPPPACVHNAPYVEAVGVSSPPGGKAGATLSYKVTVTNQDYLSCTPSTFTVRVQTPNGWSSPASVMLTINPQGRSSATISVTSPLAAVNGTYSLVFTATNDNAAGYSGSANASYLLDNTAPTVAITAPGNYQFVKGSVNFAATASDNFFVWKVDFIVCPGTLVGTVVNDTFSPFKVVWDTTKSADGNCLISALVTDLAGNNNINQSWVTVDNTAPPTPGNVRAVAGTGQITVTWAASNDNIGVASYEIRRTNSFGATAFFTVSGQTLSYMDFLPKNTTMKYQVRAHDKADNVSLFSPIAKATAK